MITVIHVQPTFPFHSLHKPITAYAINENGNRVLGQRYFCGYDKPNYPVPAIRIDCEIFPDRICIWTKLNHWDLKYLFPMD